MTEVISFGEIFVSDDAYYASEGWLLTKKYVTI